MDANGIITTVAGDPTKRSGVSTGDGGLATQAQLSIPQGLAVDDRGKLFFSESFQVRRINTNGIITTVAGESDAISVNGNGKPAT